MKYMLLILPLATLGMSEPGFAQAIIGINTDTKVGNRANPTTHRTDIVTNVPSVSVGANNTTSVRWQDEDNYWRHSYPTRTYYRSTTHYDTYSPAYRYGVDRYNTNMNRRYEDLDQEDLRRGWVQARGNSNLSWEQAQDATRDAYQRLYDRSRGASVVTDTNIGVR